MSGRHLIVVDCESTGLRSEDTAVEIAWWDLTTDDRGRFIPQHSERWAIDFGQPVALEINRYRERIAGKPQDDGTQAERLFEVLREQTLAGSNPSFDARLLECVFANADLIEIHLPGLSAPWHHRLWDLSAYAAGVLGLDELPGLARVCELLDVAPPDHTAEGDVTATGLCFQALQQRARASRSGS